MKEISMFTVFAAYDDIDGDLSFFVFEHRTGSGWKSYHSYTVLNTSMFEGQYLSDKMNQLKQYIMKVKKCEWTEINRKKRMNDMINPIMVCSFTIDESESEDRIKKMNSDPIFDMMVSQCEAVGKKMAMRFHQSEPKLQVNHFDGYATFIIAQACGMRDEPQVHTIHLTEEQARELAYEILEQLNKI